MKQAQTRIERKTNESVSRSMNKEFNIDRKSRTNVDKQTKISDETYQKAKI